MNNKFFTSKEKNDSNSDSPQLDLFPTTPPMHLSPLLFHEKDRIGIAGLCVEDSLKDDDLSLPLQLHLLHYKK